MAKIMIVPDDVGVPGALDVTNVVRQLWNTHQWTIDQGDAIPEESDPAFEEFRAFAGFPTQEDYKVDKKRRFVEHTEWLERMDRTDWGRKPDGGS